VDVIERRVAWQAISLAITFAFTVGGNFAYGNARLGGWAFAFLLLELACLAGAVILLVAAVAPDAVRPFTVEQREQFVFYAFALWVSALLVIVGFSVHSAIEAHRHPVPFG
jgi:hypothetical protein